MSYERERTAVAQLHELIAEEAEAIGPHELNDDGDPIADRPMPGAELAEWVLIMSWKNPATGESVITRATSQGLARHHENGLLHEALYEFD